MTCPNCLSQWLLSHPGSWSIIEIAPSESSILWLLMGDSRSGTKLNHMFASIVCIFCKHHIGCPPKKKHGSSSKPSWWFCSFLGTWWLDLPNATPGDRIFLMGSPWESGSNDAITYSAKTHLWHAQGGGSERYPSFKWKAKEDDSKSKLVGHNLESRTKQKFFGNNKPQSCHTLTHWLLFLLL